jgi:hypothetical protein
MKEEVRSLTCTSWLVDTTQTQIIKCMTTHGLTAKNQNWQQKSAWMFWRSKALGLHILWVRENSLTFKLSFPRRVFPGATKKHSPLQRFLKQAGNPRLRNGQHDMNTLIVLFRLIVECVFSQTHLVENPPRSTGGVRRKLPQSHMDSVMIGDVPAHVHLEVLGCGKCRNQWRSRL